MARDITQVRELLQQPTQVVVVVEAHHLMLQLLEVLAS
jgi:type II secretory pathway predicted ATPase ExeA